MQQQETGPKQTGQHGLFDPNTFYEIEPVSVPGKVLDVSMSAKEGEKLKLIIYRRNHGQNQRFKIVESCPGKYQIISSIAKETFGVLPQGGTFSVQLPNECKKSEERIFVGQVKNQPNELWEIVLASNGVYTIKSAFSGLFMDVYGGFTKDETPLIQYPANSAKNQQFVIRPKQECKCVQAPQHGLFNPSQLYEFESALKPGMLLNASLNPKQKFKMILYIRSIAENERFNIIEVSPGKYHIITTIQGKKYSLQVPCGCVTANQRLQVNQVNNQPQQYWEIVPISNGIYQVKSFNGQVVDVTASGLVNETPIIQHPFHGGKNQQWIIKPVG